MIILYKFLKKYLDTQFIIIFFLAAFIDHSKPLFCTQDEIEDLKTIYSIRNSKDLAGSTPSNLLGKQDPVACPDESHKKGLLQPDVITLDLKLSAQDKFVQKLCPELTDSLILNQVIAHLINAAHTSGDKRNLVYQNQENNKKWRKFRSSSNYYEKQNSEDILKQITIDQFHVQDLHDTINRERKLAEIKWMQSSAYKKQMQVYRQQKQIGPMNLFNHPSNGLIDPETRYHELANNFFTAMNDEYEAEKYPHLKVCYSRSPSSDEETISSPRMKKIHPKSPLSPKISEISVKNKTESTSQTLKKLKSKLMALISDKKNK